MTENSKPVVTGVQLSQSFAPSESFYSATKPGPKHGNPLLNALRSKTIRQIQVFSVVTYAVVAVLWLVAIEALQHTLAWVNSTEFSLFHHGAHVLFVAITSVLFFVVLRTTQEIQAPTVTEMDAAIDATHSGLWKWNVARDQIITTAGGNDDLGWAASDSIRDLQSWQEIVHPDDWKIVDTTLQRLNDGLQDRFSFQQRLKSIDNSWRWYSIEGRVASRSADGKVKTLDGVYHSINDIKHTELQLQHANRALSILNAAHNAVIRCESVYDMFSALVTDLASDKSYAVVAVMEVKHDSEKNIVPLFADGSSVDFIHNARITWGDTECGGGPSGTAVRTGKPCIIDDVRADPLAQNWIDLLEKYSIRSAVSIPIMLDGKARYVLQLDSPEVGAFSRDEADTFDLIGTTLSDSISGIDTKGKLLRSEQARNIATEKLNTALVGSVNAMAKIVETRDPYTSGHQQRVAEIATAIAKEMGMSNEAIEGIRIGAWMHDIGKIGVPAEILVKPGHLDSTELALIRRHASIGYEIVKSIDFGWPVQAIVLEHHERWDGSGYPNGLRGEEISIEARIVAVADVVESMATNRPYRASIPWEKVMDELRTGRSIRYDPKVIDAAMVVFDRNVERFGFTVN